jgi:hypothetical protein
MGRRGNNAIGCLPIEEKILFYKNRSPRPNAGRKGVGVPFHWDGRESRAQREMV